MRRPGVGSPTASRADQIVCPGCGCGQLQPPRGFLSRLAECDCCERAFDKIIVETLKQIVALPEAFGKTLVSAVTPRCATCPMASSIVRPAALRCCPFPSLKLDRLRRGDRWRYSRGSRSARAHQRRKGICGWGAAVVAMVGRTPAIDLA